MSELKYKSIAELSNLVGWTGPLISLPSNDELNTAIENEDEFKILKWWRFCVHPSSEEEKAISRKISEKWGSIINKYRSTNSNCYSSNSIN